ncbi:hypothetical protein PG988_016151 [Apiospora saccharicola]
MAMPEIGRSGKELQVAYKLFAMEQQEERGFEGKWAMRQTATYHTLDLTKWKTFWITVKANDLIQERVEETNTNRCGHTNLSSASEAISRSFAIHQIMFEWCTEGWGWYIDETADEVEEILSLATGVLIPSEQNSLDPVPGLVKQLSSYSSPPEKGGMQNGETKPPRTRSGISAMSVRQGRPSQNTGNSATVPETNFEPDLQTQIKTTTDRISVLKQFSFDRARKLDIISNKLRSAKTAITANLSIAGQISEIYSDLLESMNRSHTGRDQSCINESDCLRIDNIMERMNDGKNLYYHILDLQRTELEKLYSMNQRYSAVRMQESTIVMEEITKKMHTIAKRTERDTSSMHFITFLTLVFLPGTFLGSFFSTPIFGDPEEGSNKTWQLNRDLLNLFLYICVPMMVTSVGFWFAYIRYKSFRGKRKMEKDAADYV